MADDVPRSNAAVASDFADGAGRQIECEPVFEETQAMWEVRIPLAYERLFSAMICPSGMASPTQGNRLYFGRPLAALA